MSNTFNLVKNANWKAVYIEGNPEYFDQLLKTCVDYSLITPVLRMVSSAPLSPDNLDSILSDTSLPADFMLLSIDIDSYDLAIWASLKNYRPKIVVIEVNSHILPGVREWHHEKERGNSFSSTVEVGRSKGYSLVCHTGNLIFVRDDLVGRLGMEHYQLEFPESLFNYKFLQKMTLRKFLHMVRDKTKKTFKKD